MSRKWNTRKIFPFIKAKYFGLLHNNEKCITLKFFFWGMWSLRNWKLNTSFLTNMDFYLTYVRTTRSHNTGNMWICDESVSLKSNSFDQNLLFYYKMVTIFDKIRLRLKSVGLRFNYKNRSWIDSIRWTIKKAKNLVGLLFWIMENEMSKDLPYFVK